MNKHPQKRNKTSFTVAPGAIAKNEHVSFRTTEEIKKLIKEAAKNNQLSITDWLEKVIIEHLKK